MIVRTLIGGIFANSLITAAALFLLLYTPVSASEQTIWPVDAQPALTSSFGEFRPGHFHSGLDLKVYGRIGDPCRAVEDGWVSRIKVSPVGYGRAFYLKMNDGRTAVYAHLARFSQEVTEIVRSEQEERQEFSVEMYFEKEDAVHFKKGEVVGFAGRSGAKHPHLHFEIRDTEERPMNVLTQGFKVADNIPPLPVALAIEPLDGNSTVELDCQPRIYSQLIRRNDGVWGPRDPVGVSGAIGISVDAYDKADAAENLLAVYKIQMYVNNESRWVTSFDKFSFDETDLIETERNYRLYRRSKGIFHRLYHSTGNRLQLCKGDGVIQSGDRDRFPIELAIVLSDLNGNESRIELTLVPDEESDDDRLVTGSPMIVNDDYGNPAKDKVSLVILNKYIRFACSPGIDRLSLKNELDFSLETLSIDGQRIAVWIPPFKFNGALQVSAVDRLGQPVEICPIYLYRVTPFDSYEIVSEDRLFLAEIPETAVFDTTWMRIIPEPVYVIPGEIESVYRIEPMDQPLSRRVSIKLKRGEADKDTAGWGIYYLDKRSGWTFLGNSREDEYLSAPALSWETFGLVKDLDVPVLSIESPSDDESIRTGEFRLSATVKDETSGLIADDIIVKIDDQKVPAEYDPPRKKILYKPWKLIDPGKHSIEISVADRVGNKTIRSVDFNIVP